MKNSLLPWWDGRQKHLKGRAKGTQGESEKMSLVGSTPPKIKLDISPQERSGGPRVDCNPRKTESA